MNMLKVGFVVMEKLRGESLWYVRFESHREDQPPRIEVEGYKTQDEAKKRILEFDVID